MLLWQLWEFGVKSRQAFFSLLICLITCLLDILIGFIWKENINIDCLGLKRVIIIIIIWVALWAGKMERSCPLGIARFVPQEKFLTFWCLIPYNKSFKLVRSRWLGIGLVLFFWECLWTEIETKRTYNKANIQPSWPLAWSITHTYCYWLVA